MIKHNSVVAVFKTHDEAEEAIKKRHANEIENFRNLLENSERWKKATDLRNFIKELESNAIKENKLSEELSNWIKWSNDKADWFDPLVNKNDDLLTEKDKEEILSPKKPNNKSAIHAPATPLALDTCCVSLEICIQPGSNGV